MIFGTRKKKNPFIYSAGGGGGILNSASSAIAVNEDLLEAEEKAFISDVRKLTDQYSALDLMKIDKPLRLFFLEDLPYKLKEQKNRTAEQLRQEEIAKELDQELKQKISAENYRKLKEESQRYLDLEKLNRPINQSEQKIQHKSSDFVEEKITQQNKNQGADLQAIYDAPSSSVAIEPKHLKKGPEWFTEGKSVSHAERVLKSKSNQKVVLDWLRVEMYSNTKIMSLVLKCTETGARNILNKMRTDGWLVRDEVDWIGTVKKLHLFGISSIGIFHLSDPGDVQPNPNGDFKRKKTRPNSGWHQLNLQLSRLYLTRINNVENCHRLWTQEKYLPFFGDSRTEILHLKWKTYPDAVIENSHVQGLSIAIETEQEGKGRARYKRLIKQHKENIEAGGRYDLVLYVLPSREEADSLKSLFHGLIDSHISDNKLGVTIEERQVVKDLFLFDTYGDLPERIRALG